MNKFVEEFCINMANTDVLFVKIIQAISYSNSVIGEGQHENLTKYTDNVPYSNGDINYELLNSITNCYPLRLESPQNVPYRSGMISLVYILKELDTDNYYILKLKRVNIDKKLNESIHCMKSLLHIINWISYWIYSIDLTDPIRRHIDLLKVQLDFNQEIDNTRVMKEKFKNIDYVVIPDVPQKFNQAHQDYIIMEMLSGKHIQEIHQDEYEVFSRLLIKQGLYSLAVSGLHMEIYIQGMYCL